MPAANFKGSARHTELGELRRVYTLVAEAAPTHYTLLDLAPAEVERDAARVVGLARRAHAATLHPDRWAAGTDEEKRMAAAAMSAVNRAADVLEKPEERRRYLAELRGTHYSCHACSGAGGRDRREGGFSSQRVVFVECVACGGAGWLRKAPEASPKYAAAARARKGRLVP